MIIDNCVEKFKLLIMRRPEVSCSVKHCFLLAYNGLRWPWAPEEERRMSDAELPLLGPVLDGTAGKTECSDCFWRPRGLD